MCWGANENSSFAEETAAMPAFLIKLEWQCCDWQFQWDIVFPILLFPKFHSSLVFHCLWVGSLPQREWLSVSGCISRAIFRVAKGWPVIVINSTLWSLTSSSQYDQNWPGLSQLFNTLWEILLNLLWCRGWGWSTSCTTLLDICKMIYGFYW